MDGRLALDRVVPAYIAGDDDPLLGVAQQAVRDAGRAGTLGTDPAADDSSWLGNAGISTFLCGPGDPGKAHAVDEHVDVAEIRDAIAIYVRLCLALMRCEGSASAV